jgi:hypothetical protein
MAPSLKTILALGAFALLAFIIVAAFFPALFIAILFLVVLIILVVLAPQFVASPSGIAIIIILLALTAIFGFVQAGQSASLSLLGHGAGV